MKLVMTYRPPPSKKNKHSYADLLVEFTGFIEHYALVASRFANVGDFNVHWDVPSDNKVKRFAELLESLNIIQHVHLQIHLKNLTIYPIFTSSGNHGITSTKTKLLLSDHLWVECVVDMEKLVVPRETITYRKYKDNHKPSFCNDFASSLPTVISSSKQTIIIHAKHYNVDLTRLIGMRHYRHVASPVVQWYLGIMRRLPKPNKSQDSVNGSGITHQIQVCRELFKTRCAQVKRTIKKRSLDTISLR